MDWQGGISIFGLGLAIVTWVASMIWPTLPRRLLPFLLFTGFCLMLVWPVSVIFIWFNPAQLKLGAHSEASEHPSGVAVDGILWSPKFSDLRVEIANPTKFDYHNIDLLIVPDAAIAAATQVTKLQGINIWRVDPAETPVEAGNSETGKRVSLPYVTIATTVGHRVRCEVLPSETHMQLILAAVTVQGADNINSVDHVLRVDFSKGPKVWLAHKDHTDNVFGSRPKVNTVKITGRYTAQQKDYEVLEELEVIDLLRGALDKLKEIKNQK